MEKENEGIVRFWLIFNLLHHLLLALVYLNKWSTLKINPIKIKLKSYFLSVYNHIYSVVPDYSDSIYLQMTNNFHTYLLSHRKYQNTFKMRAHLKWKN